MMHVLATTLCALSAALPQSDPAHVLLREGDTLSNGDVVLEFQEFYDVLDDGRWAAVVETDRPGVTSVNAMSLLRSGTPVLTSGDVLSSGDIVSLIRHVTLDTDGRITAMVEALPPGSTNLTQVLWFDGTVLLGAGPVVAPGLPAGCVITQIEEVSRVGSRFLVTAGLGGAFLGSALLRYDYPGGGAPPAITVEALAGQPAGPPPGTLRTIYWHALASTGEVSYVVSFDPAPPSSLTGFAVSVDGVDVLVEGAPGPIPGTVWRSSVFPNDTIAAGAQWAVTGIVEDTTTLARRGVLVKNGNVLVTEGAPVPGAPGATFGAFEDPPLDLADDGTLWAVLPYTNPAGTALWRDGELVLRTGASTASGSAIILLLNDERDLAASRDGRRALFRAYLQGGVEALLSVERGLGAPVSCAVPANSTGVPGRLRFEGSSYVAVNDLVAIAMDLPANAFGYLNVSRTTGFTANPGGSLGNLCLGSPIGRYVNQVQSSGVGGQITTTLDLSALPAPTGAVAALPGQTWSFQLWHRDAGPSGAASNWSEARSVTLR